jgi:DNA-binding NarL/FixJ family response regulator
MELPDMSGLEVARAICERGDAVCVLPLSGFTDAEYVLGCLDAGASGYVTKDTPIETLVQAIRTVSKGGVYVSPRTAVDLVRDRQRRVGDDLSRKGISPRLFQILKLVAEGLGNADIAEREYRSEHTVRNQVERVKSLLDIRWRPALIAWAWRNGIQDIDEETFIGFYHRA